MAAGTPNGASDSTTNSEPVIYDQQIAVRASTKSQSHYVDPCQEFADRSIRCLHRNGKDKDLCQDYFDAYKECKKQWLEHRREERRKAGKWF